MQEGQHLLVVRVLIYGILRHMSLDDINHKLANAHDQLRADFFAEVRQAGGEP
jgi:hypothetical protein